MKMKKKGTKETESQKALEVRGELEKSGKDFLILNTKCFRNLKIDIEMLPSCLLYILVGPYIKNKKSHNIEDIAVIFNL